MSALSTNTRNSISARAIEARFAAEFEDLRRQADALALRFYRMVFPRDILALAEALPEDWLRKDHCLKFRLGYRRISLNCAEGVLVPSKNYNCNELGGIDDAQTIADYEALENLNNDFKARREEARRAVDGMLASVRSLKHLREVWPEGAPYYDHLFRAPASLPAVTSANVNALLGLPVSAPAEMAVRP